MNDFDDTHKSLSEKRYASCYCAERERQRAASDAWLKPSPIKLVDCFASLAMPSNPFFG